MKSNEGVKTIATRTAPAWRFLSVLSLILLGLAIGMLAGGGAPRAQSVETGAGKSDARDGVRDGGPDDSLAAVVLIYHRFGENPFPTTNIRLDQFEAHIAELSKPRYNVVPLSTIVSALEKGETLPPRTVAITIDDAYASIHTEAWPRLKAAGLPFTVFVSTDPVDRGIGGIMSWDQIRELHAGGVEIGNHTVAHAHMPTLSPVRARREITRAAERLEEELGAAPTLFAFPYGEASGRLMEMVAEAGYSHAFGQHSGAIGRHTQRYYLPRFPVNESFGGIDRFVRIINALPFPASDVTPDDPDLGAPGAENPPAFGFTLAEPVAWPKDIACYHSAIGRVERMERLGPRVELRFDQPFAPGRTRINCTVPTPTGRWRWFGMQYYLAE